MQYYYVELARPKLAVYEFEPDNLNELLDVDGLSHPMELNNYDTRVFNSESDAEKFLKRYEFTLKGLNNATICRSRKLPAILYKRRYIVLSLMGLKMQTFRHYRKNWKVGDCFNLHDQTYFLTVRLTKPISETPDGFRYDFELP